MAVDAWLVWHGSRHSSRPSRGSTTGSVAPESFTHGSAEQRVRWLSRGLDSGELRQCDTFAAARV
jgi:predicted metalloprotease